MRIKGVVFDLDGTLANTLEDLKDSLNMTMRDFGLPLHDDASVSACLNNGMSMFVRRAVPPEKRDDEFLEKVAEKYRYYYKLNHMNKTYFYDGVTQLLDCLKQKYHMKLAVISNKDDFYTQNIINKLDVNHNIDIACGFKEGIPHKPDPQGVTTLMKALELTPQDTVFVGDSEVDVKAARNAGLVSVGVLWGFKGRNSFVENLPDYLIEKPMDLEKILLEMK